MLRPALRFFNCAKIRLAVEHQVAELRYVWLARLDLKRLLYDRTENKIGLIGMQTHPLRMPKVTLIRNDRHPRNLALLHRA